MPYYIFAQVFGAFLAGLVLVGQYWPQLEALKAAFEAEGLSPNSLGGPGSILCSFPAATQTNYGYLFLIEWFVDSFIVSSSPFFPDTVSLGEVPDVYACLHEQETKASLKYRAS